MKLKSFDQMNCSLAQTVEGIGGLDTAHPARSIFGKKRFENFKDSDRTEHPDCATEPSRQQDILMARRSGPL
jgi:hypothetical protein